MLTIDWILLALLAVGVIRGIFTGAVKQLLSLAAFFVGLVLAQNYYCQLGAVFSDVLDHPIVCKVVAFISIWIIAPLLLKLCASAITSVLDKTLVVGTLNRLAGAILGFLGYAIILGTVIWLFATTTVLSKETLNESALCNPLKALPEAIYTVIKG